MRLFTGVTVLMLSTLTACSWFSEKQSPDTQPVPKSSQEITEPVSIQETVNRAVRRLLQTSFHYDISVDGQFEHQSLSGDYFVRTKGDRMRISSKDRVASNTSEAMHIEFDFPHLTPPVSGEIDADLLTFEHTQYVQLHKAQASTEEWKETVSEYVTPYLDQWIVIGTKEHPLLSFVPPAYAPLFPFSKQTAVDYESLTYDQKKLIGDLWESTSFVTVTEELDPSYVGSDQIRLFRGVLNSDAILDTIVRTAQIAEQPLSPEERENYDAFLSVLNLNGTIAIRSQDGYPYQVTAHGSLDGTRLTGRPVTERSDAVITFDMDSIFSDYGKTFSLEAPSESTEFEIILDSIFSRARDLERENTNTETPGAPQDTEKEETPVTLPEDYINPVTNT